jgi:hypothetical protein
VSRTGWRGGEGVHAEVDEPAVGVGGWGSEEKSRGSQGYTAKHCGELADEVHEKDLH